MEAVVYGVPQSIEVYRETTSQTVQISFNLKAFPFPSAALTGCQLILSARSDVYTPPNDTGDRIVSGALSINTNASRVYIVGGTTYYGQTVTVTADTSWLNAIRSLLGTVGDIGVEVTGTASSTGSYTYIDSLVLKLQFDDSSISGTLAPSVYLKDHQYTIPVRHRYRGVREGGKFYSSANMWSSDIVNIWYQLEQLRGNMDDNPLTVTGGVADIQHIRTQLRFRRSL